MNSIGPEHQPSAINAKTTPLPHPTSDSGTLCTISLILSLGPSRRIDLVADVNGGHWGDGFSYPSRIFV